jgi:hypothetical protein
MNIIACNAVTRCIPYAYNADAMPNWTNPRKQMPVIFDALHSIGYKKKQGSEAKNANM